jgi:aryl-alcohol dehydrogenase-like predicted oxidoreductase
MLEVRVRYRELGRTGISVSEIGYGAWGIGKSEWVGAEDEESMTSLKAARDAGVNFFDTALAYGMGHSERLIAKAFGKSPEVVIASKVPPKNFVWPAADDSGLEEVFPRGYVLNSLDETLSNLGREQVDVYQFHVWNDRWAGEEEWLETVRLMRDSGKVRAVGISINDHQPANSLNALATGLIDTVQVIYNIFDQSPEDELFPFCREHGIGVIARVPFDEGSLTGKIRPDTKFTEGDFRNEYFRGNRKTEVWERVSRIASAAGVRIEDMPQLALRFCLSAPEVSTVIPGMRNAVHVASNVAVSDDGPLSSAVLTKLHGHRWVRNYYS